MEFMILFLERRGAAAGRPAGMAEFEKFAGELMSRGKLRRGAQLHPERAGARVRVRDGRALVSDGPFAESKEIVAGFWIVEAESRGEAIALARRAWEVAEPRPEARDGAIEVHAARVIAHPPKPGGGVPFLLAFRMEPGLVPTPSKMHEMMVFGTALAEAGVQLETAPLLDEPAPARIESHGGKTLVVDGPFAESKEAVGGYSLIRVADRAAAIELAGRYPHAKWGPVEVREIV